MEEKRRHKRLDIDVSVQLERLDEDGVTTLKYCHVDVTDISEAVSDLMQRYLLIYIHIMTPRSKFGPRRLWMRLSRLYEEQTVKKEYITMVLCLSV